MTQQSLVERMGALHLSEEQLAAMRQSLLLDLAGNLYQCGQILALVNADGLLHTLGLRFVVSPAAWQGWTTLQS